MASKVCKLQKSDGAHVGLNIKINLYENFINIEIKNNDDFIVENIVPQQQIPMKYISTRTLEEDR